MKYVKFDDARDMILVFGEGINHDSVIPFQAKVVSAGFVKLEIVKGFYGENRIKAKCYGESKSLEVKSLPEDSEMLTSQFNQGA